MQILILTRHVFNWKDVIIQVWRYRDIMYVNHASHTVSIFQYVHAWNLLSYVRCVDKLFQSLWTWYQGENHSLTALYWKDNAYQIDDICQKEQWETGWISITEVKESNWTSHIIRSTSTMTFGMVFSMTWFKFEDQAFGDSKIRYTLKEHSANCPLFFLVIVLTV